MALDNKHNDEDTTTSGSGEEQAEKEQLSNIEDEKEEKEEKDHGRGLFSPKEEEKEEEKEVKLPEEKQLEEQEKQVEQLEQPGRAERAQQQSSASNERGVAKEEAVKEHSAAKKVERFFALPFVAIGKVLGGGGKLIGFGFVLGKEAGEESKKWIGAVLTFFNPETRGAIEGAITPVIFVLIDIPDKIFSFISNILGQKGKTSEQSKEGVEQKQPQSTGRVEETSSIRAGKIADNPKQQEVGGAGRGR